MNGGISGSAATTTSSLPNNHNIGGGGGGGNSAGNNNASTSGGQSMNLQHHNLMPNTAGLITNNLTHQVSLFCNCLNEIF